MLLILALFVADAAGAPDELGDVASVAWSALVVGAGVVLWRRADDRNERVFALALWAAGLVSLAAWLVDVLT